MDKKKCLKMEPMILETDYFLAEYADKIIQVQYKPKASLTLEDAEKIVAERLRFYKDLSAPVLIKHAKIKRVEKAAREYFFDPERGLKNVKAIALVHDNFVNQMLGTIIFYFNSPCIPHKMFSDEQEAINWLKQFV